MGHTRLTRYADSWCSVRAVPRAKWLVLMFIVKSPIALGYTTTLPCPNPGSHTQQTPPNVKWPAGFSTTLSTEINRYMPLPCLPESNTGPALSSDKLDWKCLCEDSGFIQSATTGAYRYGGGCNSLETTAKHFASKCKDFPQSIALDTAEILRMSSGGQTGPCVEPPENCTDKITITVPDSTQNSSASLPSRTLATPEVGAASSQPLSDGAIAAIVIASVGVCSLVGICYWLCFRKHAHKRKGSTSSQSSGTGDSSAVTETGVVGLDRSDTLQTRKRNLTEPATDELTETDASKTRAASNHIPGKPCAWPKQCILFDANDGAYQKRAGPDGDTEDFITRMTTFVTKSILSLPATSAHITRDRQKRKIRFAVLDTGIHMGDFHENAQTRIILKRNFVGNDEMAYDDTYGHGTHIALDWVCTPECDADIIVMSFGLGEDAHPRMAKIIEELVANGKLVFAAASNGGGNEPRAFPAKADGVFCIHVSDGKGNKTGINPPAWPGDINFSTLGNIIPSKWQGTEVYVSGSSFAAPFAASIAANALEFIRHTLTNPNDDPGYFYRYQGMYDLFRCLSDRIDDYDYVKPWKRHLWDEGTHWEGTREALRAIACFGADKWIKRTSEKSFKGYPSDVDETN
ncbi:hypothetical protein NLG97_g6066 [Lecanicillium saksenae]|uniref:Uncharacterized protein n=1 Tax=Lecanicillium saksenae TaxID=468837 RepID=A0ACC1QSJ9_9HYPO|nr:hypothetical protein NLG97_g6066 [Lecanicillium saksenae]